MISKNFISGIIFLCLGFFVLIAIPSQIPESDSLFGPRIFPFVVSCIIILSSIILLIQELLHVKKHKPCESVLQKPDKTEALKTTLSFVITGLYIILFEKIGFIPSSILFVIASLLFFRTRKKSFYVILISIVIIIYVLFTYPMKVVFP